MKKLLGILSVMTLASGVITPAIYPINSAANTNNKTITETPFVAATRSAVDDAFKNLQEESEEFSLTALYTTTDGLQINGSEYLEIAKEKSNALLTDFNNSDDNSEANFIEFLREKVPSFNAS
jgi:hypothetical protein